MYNSRVRESAVSRPVPLQRRLPERPPGGEVIEGESCDHEKNIFSVDPGGFGAAA